MGSSSGLTCVWCGADAVDVVGAVLAGAGAPSIRERAAAGVARVSFGPGPMGVAYAALARLVADIQAGNPGPDDLAYRPGRS